MATTQPNSGQQITRAIFIWVVVMLVSIFLMMGEFVWILFWLWLPFYVGYKRPAQYGLQLGLLSFIILFPHSLGYKMFGSARVVNNAPFKPELFITAFGPGTTVTISDGRSFQIAGITEEVNDEGIGLLGPRWEVAGFDRKQRNLNQYLIEHTDQNKPLPWGEAELSMRLWETKNGIPVLIQEKGNGRAQLILGSLSNYWCGNTFFPTPFPERLPRYAKADLALMLLERGKVKPDNSIADEDYQKKLERIYAFASERRERNKKITKP